MVKDKTAYSPVFDPFNRLFAAGVLVITLITYLATVQPSVPYWDCGEFIACATTLSVPHPPGTPLFLLIGRLFSYIPFGEPAWRVNLVSAVSSAFAVMFAYLIVSNIIRSWFRKVDSTEKRLTMYVGGVVGALFMAFSRTFWNSAVEAEVYGLSMLIMMAGIYLVLLWSQFRHEPRSEKYLYLFGFLAVLGIGVHMTSFIIVPLAFMFLLAKDEELRVSIPFWVTFIILILIPVSLTYYLVLATLWVTISAIAFYWQKIRNSWIYTLFIPGIIFLFMTYSGWSKTPMFIYCFAGWSLVTMFIYGLSGGQKKWRMAYVITLLGLVGFSVQMYTPIRSMADPVIDMNNPESWDELQYFIERKQYGSENMFVRMLDRRGELANQFGTHERMGFWGFFHEQYSRPSVFLPIFFLLGLIGVAYLIRQRWRMGTFMFLILLAGTVGLVFYMNFADGTEMDPITGMGRLEVRDRDYFFTPGFIVFGMFIGIGVAAIMNTIFSYMREKNHGESSKKIFIPLMSLFILLPLVAFSRNYYICDRSDNYLAYDYAKNLLESCAPNSILFTNGDNDTFPVWCLQYTYGIRPDVRVIVLSLLQIDWYITQQRDKFDVPISYTDDQINLLRPYLLDRNTAYLVSNQVTDNIIDNSMVKSTNPDQWPELPMKCGRFINFPDSRKSGDTTLYLDPPVQFATTVDPNGFRYHEVPVDRSKVDAVIEGMVYDVRPNKLENDINTQFTYDFFINKLQTRGVTDPTVYKDENARRLSDNYWKIVAKMADEVFKAGNPDLAIDMNYKAVQISVSPAEAFRFLTKNLMYADRTTEVGEYMEKVQNASEEELLQQSCQILNILFSQEINTFRNRLVREGADPSGINLRIATEFVNDKDYVYYLKLLDRFYEKYPQNQDMLSFIEIARSQVLNYLTPAARQRLDLNFMAAEIE